MKVLEAGHWKAHNLLNVPDLFKLTAISINSRLPNI